MLHTRKKIITNDAIAAEFSKLNMRLDSIETQMATRSNIYAAVFQGVATAAATIIGAVIVVKVVGGFG